MVTTLKHVRLIRHSLMTFANLFSKSALVCTYLRVRLSIRLVVTPQKYRNLDNFNIRYKTFKSYKNPPRSDFQSIITESR